MSRILIRGATVLTLDAQGDLPQANVMLSKPCQPANATVVDCGSSDV